MAWCEREAFLENNIIIVITWRLRSCIMLCILAFRVRVLCHVRVMHFGLLHLGVLHFRVLHSGCNSEVNLAGPFPRPPKPLHHIIITHFPPFTLRPSHVAPGLQTKAERQNVERHNAERYNAERQNAERKYPGRQKP